MTKLSKTAIVVFHSEQSNAAGARRRFASHPILLTRWHVSSRTGKLECAWVHADTDDPDLLSS